MFEPSFVFETMEVFAQPIGTKRGWISILMPGGVELPWEGGIQPMSDTSQDKTAFSSVYKNIYFRMLNTLLTPLQRGARKHCMDECVDDDAWMIDT